MPEQRPSPDFVSLEDRAIQLRRAALQTRFRLAEQRAALEKIAASLNRAAGSVTAPKAPPPPPPLPLPRPVSAPVQRQQPVFVNKAERGGVHVPGPFVAPLPTPPAATKRTVPASVGKEAVAVSAPAAASLRTEAARHAPALLRALLPFAAIGAAAMVAHARIAPRLAVITAPSVSEAAAAPGRDALVRLEPPAPAEDDGSAEALLLVHEWVPEGGDRNLLSLLGGELDRPDLPPSWTVERTGPRSFLVRFRDGSTSHDFEADLESRAVRPAGETAALFAGR